MTEFDQSSDLNLASKVFQLLFLVLTLFSSILLNGLLVYSLVKRSESTSSAGNRFLFSLTLSNLINALVSLPMLISAAAVDSWSWGGPLCRMGAFLHLLIAVNGNLTMALIGYERYHAIVKPSQYQHNLSNTRSLLMLLGVLIFSILFTSAPLFGWSTYAYHPSLFICSISWNYHPIYTLILFLIAVLAPFIIMLICYTYIYMATRLQRCSIFQQTMLSRKFVKEGTCCGDVDITDPLLTQSPPKLKHKLPWVIVTYSNPTRAGRTLIILLVSFTLCWGAMFVWAVSEIAGTSSSALAFISYFIYSLSAICNPLVYGFMNKPIRRSMMRMMCKRRRNRRRSRSRRKKSVELASDTPHRPSRLGRVSLAGSKASFFDYVPDKGEKMEKLEIDGNVYICPVDNGGIDSYEVIQLWMRKWNPFKSGSFGSRHEQNGNYSGMKKDKNVSLEYITDQNSTPSSPEINNGGSVIQIESVQPNAPVTLSDDLPFTHPTTNSQDSVSPSSELNSPVVCTSLLSSVTQFTDIPPEDPSTSNDDIQYDLRLAVSPESDV